ncbi:hypothetical protein LWI29_008490 [Acer saccharum]|uniref:Exostosin GT47 domain-containing protein n=1 Tax=Acer saccharum TaxID=4024 RepID=A0AA39T345_ACESA|nr:hypothetical protein LWI29_008490 [Acer saccharum]
MGERSKSSLGIITRKSLFSLFTIASILFFLSWFFVLRSTSIDSSLFTNTNTNSNPLPVVNNGNSEPRIRNRTILNDSVEEEEAELPQKKCNTKNKAILKVYMYDLPPEFHFELLDWKAQGGSVWPDVTKNIPQYPGGLNLQHSIEYWLTLDLLASEISNIPRASSVIRVRNSTEADFIFVPFFASLSYNKFSKKTPHKKKGNDRALQDKLVDYVMNQELWKQYQGKDHFIVAHHPNSLLTARMKLWRATFILSDFGRYPPNIANVDKDVIAPYKHVIKPYVNDTSDFDTRPTLLYFQGAIYRKDGGFARQELFYLLKDEKDVHFTFGSVQRNGINKATQGMHASKFCLNIAGDTPSSNRLFDAIVSHCVPVIISDEIELPYEDVLDYSEFCIFVRTSDAVKEHFLINLIRSIKKDEWSRMRDRLKEVEDFFKFQYPSKEGDAVQMIWQAVARKVPAMRLRIHKSKRFSHTVTKKEHELKLIPSPRNFW